MSLAEEQEVGVRLSWSKPPTVVNADNSRSVTYVAPGRVGVIASFVDMPAIEALSTMFREDFKILPDALIRFALVRFEYKNAFGQIVLSPAIRVALMQEAEIV